MGLDLDIQCQITATYCVKALYLSQSHRDEIANTATRKLPGQPYGDFNGVKYAEGMADAEIGGWTGCTELALLECGIYTEPAGNGELRILDPQRGMDLGKLHGWDGTELSYSQHNARLIYQHAHREKFSAIIDDAARRALEAVIAAKKSALASSVTSPALLA